MGAKQASDGTFDGAEHLTIQERKMVQRAIEMAAEAHGSQVRADGTPYIAHLRAVATILADWKADADTIIAGLLHDTLEDTLLTLAQIEEEFGRPVSLLVEGVTKFTQADFADKESIDGKVETFRKLLDVMRRDIRAVIIKLADRLHNVRTIHSLPPERRNSFAVETLEIYSKLAYHLGMNGLRREFSEICVPIAYPEVSPVLFQMRLRAQRRSKEVHADVERHLLQSHEGRHARPIVRVAQRSLDSLLQLQLRGELRENMAFYLILISPDEEGCYAILKQLHTLYRPISGKFRDHIAAPAEGGYRSLHTTVLGPHGAPLQVRIRTLEMDEEDRIGIAARLFRHGDARIENLLWLIRSANLDLSTQGSSRDFWKALQVDIFRNAQQVTVDAEAVSVPVGATVLDAVYALYGLEAHRLRSAELNGAPVAFGEHVTEDGVIRTLMDTEQHTTFEWLEEVTTGYARNLIVEALKQRSREEKLVLGERLLQKELDYFRKGLLGSLSKQQREQLTAHFRRNTFEDILLMIGEGVLPARDVLFLLYPEDKGALDEQGGQYAFRLLIRGSLERHQDVLLRLSALARTDEIDIVKTDLQFRRGARTFDLRVRGFAPDRLHFADFVAALDRQPWTSSVETMISYEQKVTLVSAIICAFGVIALDILLLPQYHRVAALQLLIPAFVIQAIPLLPIFGVNYYLLRLLRHFLPRMRSGRWFLGLGFLLNVLGLFLVVSPAASGGSTESLLPLVALFLFSMFYLGYRFFQTEAIFRAADRQPMRPLTHEEWKRRKRKKIGGYALRLAAVTIWGIQPLYIKYTPANQVPLSLRVLLIWLGIFLVGFIPIVVRWIGAHLGAGRPAKMRLPFSREFFGIVIGYMIFMFCFNVSLRFTTSTNVILLNNFSPVLALLIGAIFWRQSIPYLRDPKHMLWIFLVFLLGSTGSSLIIYYDLGQAATGRVWGDLFALLAMGGDTMLAISQIRYMRLAKDSSSLAINVFVSSILIALTLPLAFYTLWNSGMAHLLPMAVFHALGVGILTGIGQILNYETFRRIDGFIAFLMFNISILITFVAEVLFLDKFVPSWIIILGGISIVGSTILAEIINSHCEKKGM